MKRYMKAVMAVLCAVVTGVACAVDLAGVSQTVTSLAPEGYTNSGAAATLTLVLEEDVSYAGVIQGPISVVKKGDGKLTLSGQWTHTNGTTVEGGMIRVPSESYLCGEDGTVTLNGGGVALTTSGTAWQKRKLLVPPGAVGTINIATNQMADMYMCNVITFTNATLKIAGGGMFYAMVALQNDSQVKGGTLLVEDGTLQFGSQVFGPCAGTPLDFTIRVSERGRLRVAGNRYMALPKYVIMKGGAIEAAEQENIYGASLTHAANSYESLTLSGTLTVEPSETPTRILNYSAALAPLDAETTFDVQEGATLEIDSRLTPGMATSGSAANYRTDQGFSKFGKGRLVLKGPVGSDGLIYVSDGTLELSSAAYLSCISRIKCEPTARVVLSDGTTLAAAVMPAEPQDAFIATAEVWMDASRLPWKDGQSVFAVPNFGTCGGSFGPLNPGTYSAKSPTFSQTGIGGKPAIAFNGTQALLLHSYTNKGSQIEVYCVYQVTDPSRWGTTVYSICCASGACGFDTDYGVVGQPNGHVIFCSNGSWLKMMANHGSRRYTIDISSTGVDQTVPFLLEHCRSAGNVFSGKLFYGPGAADVGTASITGHTVLQDNEIICLGGFLFTDGSWYGDPKGFKGRIGELIVFSRELTSAERAYVETYLRRKWLGASDELLPLNGYTNETHAKLSVSTPSGKAVLATGSSGTSITGVLEKTEAGSLVYASESPALSAVAVKSGSLEFAEANCGSAAAIWIDASDASTRTLDASDGVTRVKSIRNKGSAGGVFTQNPYPYEGSTLAPCPPYADGGGGINGLGVLAFDRLSALSSEAYVNRGRNTCGLYIYGVFERTEWSDNASQGKGAGPFSMSEKASPNWDVSSDNAFFWYEDYGPTCRRIIWNNSTMKKDTSYEYTGFADTHVPYLMSIQCGNRTFLVSEMVKDGDSMITTSGSKLTFNSAIDYAPFSLDIINLGGRLAGNGRPAALFGLNRMWHGKIGEFLVFDRQLSQADEKALVDYLCKKWFNVGAGSAVPPDFLTGRVAAPSFAPDTALTLADGVQVGFSAGQPIMVGALTSEGSVTVNTSRSRDSDWMPLMGYNTFDGSLGDWLYDDGRSTLSIRNKMIGLAGIGFSLFIR